MKQATGFISDAGNHFDDEYNALKDDLRYKLEKSLGNAPMARDAIEAVCADLKEWAGTLGHMISLAPKEIAAETRTLSDPEFERLAVIHDYGDLLSS